MAEQEYVLLRDEDKLLYVRDQLYRVETDLYRRELAEQTGDPAAAATGPNSPDLETLQEVHKKLVAEYKSLSGSTPAPTE